MFLAVISVHGRDAAADTLARTASFFSLESSVFNRQFHCRGQRGPTQFLGLITEN